jgi:hypothetical protein
MAKVKAFVTPLGSAKWASIVTPNTKWDEAGKYEITVEFKPEQVVECRAYLDTVLKDFIAEKKPILNKAKQNTVTVVSPFKDVLDVDGNPTGEVSLKGKAYTTSREGEPLKVAIADSKGRIMPNFNKLVGNGSKVKVALYPKAYYMGSNNTFGLSLTINSVQIVELIEYTRDGFKEEEGGFVADDADFKAPHTNQEFPQVEAEVSGDF